MRFMLDGCRVGGILAIHTVRHDNQRKETTMRQHITFMLASILGLFLAISAGCTGDQVDMAQETTTANVLGHDNVTGSWFMQWQLAQGFVHNTSQHYSQFQVQPPRNGMWPNPEHFSGTMPWVWDPAWPSVEPVLAVHDALWITPTYMQLQFDDPTTPTRKWLFDCSYTNAIYGVWYWDCPTYFWDGQQWGLEGHAYLAHGGLAQFPF